MTISNTTNRRVYTGPGDEFTYDFPVFDDDDIYVVITQEGSDAQIEPDGGGAGTYDFTISGSYNSTALRYPNGVTVTLNNPLPDASYTIAIECRPAQTQGSDYVNGGPLNAERLETDFDRLITIAQYIVGGVEGAVRVSPTAGVSIPPLVPQANAILVWDENGEAIVNREVFGRWRDVWETDTLYVPLDIVRFEENGDAKDGNLYLCAEEHESDVFDTDLAADRWQLIIDVAAVENAKDAAEAAQSAAETAESNAAASASAAATSESNAATSESNAATSESNAAASESAAAVSEDLAERWATEDEDTVVDDGKFSSFHWAQKAEDYAATAANAADAIYPDAGTVEGSNVPAGVQALFTQGYSEAGDGGGALYKRVGLEPSHAGKIQSADGAWWELTESVINVKMFGAVGDGVTDDSTAINNAIGFISSGIIFFPTGDYSVESTILIEKENIQLVGEGPGAAIIVNAQTDQPAIQVGDGVTSFYRDRIRGIRVQQDSSVTAVSGNCGIFLNNVSDTLLSDIRVGGPSNQLYDGIKVTDTYEAKLGYIAVNDCLNDGIILTGGLDTHFDEVNSHSNDNVGMRIDGSNGIYSHKVHCYSNRRGFLIGGSTPCQYGFFTNCIADTSQGYNWQIEGLEDSALVGCWGSTQQDTTTEPNSDGFLFITNVANITVTACVAINNNRHGFNVQPGAENVAFVGCVSGESDAGDANGQAGSGYGFVLSGDSDIRVTGGSALNNADGAVQNADRHHVQNLSGYVTENSGVSGGTTDADGELTIAHGLSATPNFAITQFRAGNVYDAKVVGVDATNLTVRISDTTDNSNVASASIAANIAWKAEL